MHECFCCKEHKNQNYNYPPMPTGRSSLGEKGVSAAQSLIALLICGDTLCVNFIETIR